MTAVKERFPFSPFQDSFFLEVADKVYKRLSPNQKNLMVCFSEKWGDAVFRFSPNQWKQIHIPMLADMIRKLFNSHSEEDVLQLLEDLVEGKTSFFSEEALDSALELVEWIFTGFEKETIVLQFLQYLLGNPNGLDSQFFQELQTSYEREVQSSLS